MAKRLQVVDDLRWRQDLRDPLMQPASSSAWDSDALSQSLHPSSMLGGRQGMCV